MSDTIRCERCGEKLNPKKLVWLELDQYTGIYHDPKKFPEDSVSQGLFTFGSACAKRELYENLQKELLNKSAQ